MVERARKAQAAVNALGAGLPRPLRGHEPRDDGRRREHRRQYALEQLGLEVESLPAPLQRLVLSHKGPLQLLERKRLANALLARGIDVGRVGLVFNLLGDRPVDDVQLYRLAWERERSQQLSENFAVLGVVRHRTRPQNPPRYLISVQLDAHPECEVFVDVSAPALVDQKRFCAACVDQAGFMPVFREASDRRTYSRFVAWLLEMLEEPHAD